MSREDGPPDAPVARPEDPSNATIGDTAVTTGTIGGPADESAPPTPHPTFDRPDDRFALGNEIGRGGMGRVFAATDASLGREVAIKQMLSERPDDLARFEREVRITAQLEHPSIVPIYEAARDHDGRAYYVMRRIEGEPLSRRLIGRDVRDRLALLPNVLAVVDAAAFAHARQIIHRDIKPSNILLGGYGETHLIDWGLARRLDESELGSTGSADHGEQLTRAGHVYGTVAYMAPEQARGEPVDRRADVYALGATLFHVLAGSAPFAELSDAERLAAAEAGEDAVPLQKLGADTPRELVAIVDKAMARDVEARYAHAGELAADLRAFLSGQLVGAHRYTAGQRLARFVRKHRVAVAISVVATVALATVGILAIVNILEERDQANRSQAETRRANLAIADASVRAQLDRASMLAEVDPARAINLLRGLARPYRNIARDIAAKAAAYGIPRGSKLHDTQILSMAMSPDGVRLATTDHRGVVGIHQLENAESRELTRLAEGAYFVDWIDKGSALVVATPSAVFRIDPTSGATRELARVKTGNAWLVRDADIRLVDLEQRRLVELSGGGTRVLAENVEAAVGAEEIAIVSNDDELRLLDGSKVVVLDTKHGPLNTYAVAISTELGRIAYATREHVIEWDIANRRESRRWGPPMVGLMYGGKVLYGMRNGRLYELGTSVDEVSRSRGNVGWSRIGKLGATFVFDDGALIVINKGGTYERSFAHVGTRLVATGATSRFVAVGSANGLIRWWDLTPIAPQPIAGRPTAICWVDREWLVARYIDELVAIDQATGKSRPIAGGLIGTMANCIGRFGHHVAYSVRAGPSQPERVGYIDLRTGARIEYPQDTWLGVDTLRRVLVVQRGRAFSELSNGVEKLRWTAPSDVQAFSVRKGWLAVATADHTLTRVTPDGTISTTKLRGAHDEIRVASSGDVYIFVGTDVMRWSGHGEPEVVYRFSKRVLQAVTHDERLIILHEDQSLWTVGPRGDARSVFPARSQWVHLGHGEVVAARERTRLTTSHLGTGVQTTRWFPSGINGAFMADSGDVVVALNGSRNVVLRDAGPETADDVDAWIDTVTNARLVAGSEELTWK